MRRLFSALSFLTIVPIPGRLQAKEPQAMFAAYPAAGLLIGLALAGAAAGAAALLPAALAAVAVVAANVLLTGGMHLDGLADCADAFYGYRDRARVLEILKDPRIGTMGGVAIGLSLLTRFAAVFSLPLPALLAGLLLSATLGRTVVIIGLKLLPYARKEGGILSTGSQVSLPLVITAVVILAGITVVAPVPSAAAFTAVGVLWLISWRKIGGSTGDVLGASIALAEVFFLAALAAEAAAGEGSGAFHGFLRVFLGAVTG